MLDSTNIMLMTCNACLVIALSLVLVWYFNKYKNVSISFSNAKELINNLEEGVYHSSLEGKQLSANPALVKLNGYDTEAELLNAVEDISREWYVDPGRRAEFTRQLHENGKITGFVSEIYRHNTRERIWITENARLVCHARTGKPLYYEGTVRDITDTVTREQSERLLKNLTDKLSTGLFQLIRWPDKSFTAPYVSQKFREMGNLSESEAFDAKKFVSQIHPDDLNGYQQSLKNSGIELTEWNHEFRFVYPDGRMEWCKIQASSELCETGAIVWHGHLSNITERKAAEEQVNKLAYFDPLTGLSNRTHFVDQLKEYMETKEEKQPYSALCFIDLDNFKLLNDSHGHGFGDKLLQAMAERLEKNIHNDCLLSRFGGDEFVIMLKYLGSNQKEAQEKAKQVSQILLREVQRGFVIEGIDTPMTMSLGIAMFDNSQKNHIGDLLKSADIAMYEAKKSGRNNVVFHDINTQKAVADDHKLQRDIQFAVKESQFKLELQPQVDQSGKIKCAETLTRWHHPTRGKIMPNEFIKLAEQNGQIGNLNYWVLAESIRILSSWRNDKVLKDIVLSVNISPRQMLDPQFVQQVEALLKEHNIPSRCLMIELTEHVMARNPERVEKHMKQLQAAGVRFSLDDFGTGYSSISQLRTFPFDELKIDGSFVADITKQPEVQSLVTAILNMARTLGLKTVAEHVSTHDQLELLKSLGCDLFQGFLFSRSLSVKDFETFVLAHSTPQQRQEYINPAKRSA